VNWFEFKPCFLRERRYSFCVDKALSFYKDLPAFKDFNQIADDSSYYKAPPEWWVIVTDVEGSTKAIDEGRYKDVNTLGAAAIASVINTLGEVEFPFVFGGDGATFLIPDYKLQEIQSELAALKAVAKEKFHLGLRVGMIQVKDLSLKGGLVRVAKFELNPGQHLAKFNGGGLVVAEKLIKAKGSPYEIQTQLTNNPRLDGLSCRWNPVKNKNGLILSLLVMARGDHPERIYKDLLQQIEKICDCDLKAMNPVNNEGLSYLSTRSNLSYEGRFFLNLINKKFFKRIISIFLSFLIFKVKVSAFKNLREDYLRDLSLHSDFRKFDDMLRMILDCSQEQYESLKSHLEGERLKGSLNYGLHTSSDCLMTCFVPSMEKGKHIHFIDGGNGGYAMAAKQFKEQLKQNSD